MPFNETRDYLLMLFLNAVIRYVDRGDNSCQLLSLSYTMVMQSSQSLKMAANEGFSTECTNKSLTLVFIRHLKCLQSMFIFWVVEFVNGNVGLPRWSKRNSDTW